MFISGGRGLCVNVSAIGKILCAFIFLGNGVSSMILETKNVVADLHEDTDIVLNCTYYKESTESISNSAVRWQKHMEGGYMDVAFFSPPGGAHPFIQKEMQTSYVNRTVLQAPNDSHTAVLIINNLVCGDQGLYRCWIEYIFDSSSHIQTSVTSVIFKEKAKEPIFSIFPIKIEENQLLTLTCKADVGIPHGNIKISKIPQNSNTPELIYTSNSTEQNFENCTYVANISNAYHVSRGDNEAVFRCSSQNSLNQEEPSVTSSRISVIYGPEEPLILANPNKSNFNVGENVDLHCKTDSNPPSNITWTFLQPETHSDGTKAVSYNIGNGSILTLSNIQLNHTGTYICNASNDVGKSLRSISITVSVPVKNSKTDCEQCGYTERCQRENGEANCVTIIWIPIAIMFILLSVTFTFIIIALVKRRNSMDEKQSSMSSFIHLEISPSNELPEESNVDHTPLENLTETQNDSESLKPQDILI